jgi:L-iditol 2-dehydrogenase
MKAAFRQKPGVVECVEVKEPATADDKVLIRVKHVGICGSDIARVKDMDPKWNDLILGHEAVGIVEDISEKISKEYLLNIGERVAIIPLIPCGRCRFCIKGMYSSCINYSFIGSRINGALAEYLSVGPKNLIKLPDDGNLEKYIFLEPLSVAIHAVSQTDIRFGKKVLLFGSGTIGLLIYQLLKNLISCEVIVVDIDDFKLNIAEKLGSVHNLNINNTTVQGYIEKNAGFSGIDEVFEVSGANSVIKNAIESVNSGGSIIQVGTPSSDIHFDKKTFELIIRKELRLIGCWMSYSGTFPGTEWSSAVKFLNNDSINVEHLATHRFMLKDIDKAFNMICKNTDNYCKVIINI